jgi:hypothetical protein
MSVIVASIFLLLCLYLYSYELKQSCQISYYMYYKFNKGTIYKEVIS